MERLSGLDASFLYLETDTLHMHVSMAAVFDPSTMKGGYSFERIRDLVAGRLVQTSVFRRRLVQVPFRLGHPYWVEDPSFDIDFHLRRAALPAPGGLIELSEFVGDVCSRQLDRSRPLWQMYIVENLEGGNFALVTKLHHSTIDGVSGAELLAKLFDLSPDPDPDEREEARLVRARIPSDLQLVAQALLTRLTKPPKIARLAWRTAFALKGVAKVRTSDDKGGKGKGALPLTAPRTSFNAAITPHRKVAFSSISLDDVKTLKNLMGMTVNDVVLAVVTGALRDYLMARDELPEIPLVASVPVSVQGAPGVSGSNAVSAMFVSLPTHLEDPMERIRAIHESTKGAKEEHKALGASVLLDWVEHATPNVFGAAARTYSRLKLADRHRPIHNLIVSNVPGPDFPIYFSGATLVAGFPLGPVLEGAGLNITVMSYRGTLNWGIMACRETVEGAHDLADAIPAALDELMLAAGLPPATPWGVAPGSRGERKLRDERKRSERRELRDIAPANANAKKVKAKTSKAPAKKKGGSEKPRSRPSKSRSAPSASAPSGPSASSVPSASSNASTSPVTQRQVSSEPVPVASAVQGASIDSPAHGASNGTGAGLPS